MLLFPEAGTNVAAHSGSPDHDDDLFAGCDVVVSDSLDEPAAGPVPRSSRGLPSWCPATTVV